MKPISLICLNLLGMLLLPSYFICLSLNEYRTRWTNKISGQRVILLRIQRLGFVVLHFSQVWATWVIHYSARSSFRLMLWMKDYQSCQVVVPHFQHRIVVFIFIQKMRLKSLRISLLTGGGNSANSASIAENNPDIYSWQSCCPSNYLNTAGPQSLIALMLIDFLCSSRSDMSHLSQQSSLLLTLEDKQDLLVQSFSQVLSNSGTLLVINSICMTEIIQHSAPELLMPAILLSLNIYFFLSFKSFSLISHALSMACVQSFSVMILFAALVLILAVSLLSYSSSSWLPQQAMQTSLSQNYMSAFFTKTWLWKKQLNYYFVIGMVPMKPQTQDFTSFRSQFWQLVVPFWKRTRRGSTTYLYSLFRVKNQDYLRRMVVRADNIFTIFAVKVHFVRRAKQLTQTLLVRLLSSLGSSGMKQSGRCQSIIYRLSDPGYPESHFLTTLMSTSRQTSLLNSLVQPSSSQTDLTINLQKLLRLTTYCLVFWGYIWTQPNSRSTALGLRSSLIMAKNLGMLSTQILTCSNSLGGYSSCDKSSSLATSSSYSPHFSTTLLYTSLIVQTYLYLLLSMQQLCSRQKLPRLRQLTIESQEYQSALVKVGFDNLAIQSHRRRSMSNCCGYSRFFKTQEMAYLHQSQYFHFPMNSNSFLRHSQGPSEFSQVGFSRRSGQLLCEVVLYICTILILLKSLIKLWSKDTNAQTFEIKGRLQDSTRIFYLTKFSNQTDEPCSTDSKLR